MKIDFNDYEIKMILNAIRKEKKYLYNVIDDYIKMNCFGTADMYISLLNQYTELERKLTPIIDKEKLNGN